DYTDRPWRLAPMGPEPAGHPAAAAAGWSGAIPVVDTPSGQPMWDSTSMIEHLDQAPDLPAGRGVLPDDPTLRFLAYLLDDVSDEWFYRPAVGSRWCYDANTITAGWQLAEELAVKVPVPGAMVRQIVVATMTGSLGRIGVHADQIDVWMSEVVVPWFSALDAHLRADAGGGYLFGERPSIADFAVFGANAAHFVGDPYCRELADAHGPAVVAHTHRLRLPQEQTFGPWLDAGEVPPTLVAIVAEAGRHYLPWVAEATREGSAVVELADGVTVRIESSRFLEWARGVLLARYVELRSDALDAVLEEAGVLRYFVDHLDQATAVPVSTDPPQPSDNRPYATR
ncbi:MAG: glutathione S-transferase C-terminal domain-containing protein, partial [Ilumatobacteraceae bacterium]